MPEIPSPSAPTWRWPLRLAVFLLAITAVATGCSSAPTVDAPPTLTPQEAQGEQVFTRHCASCHATDPDVVLLGPSLNGVATRSAQQEAAGTPRQYLERSILEPAAEIVPGFSDTMPPDFGKRLSAEELQDLIAFLLTLK